MAQPQLVMQSSPSLTPTSRGAVSLGEPQKLTSTPASPASQAPVGSPFATRSATSSPVSRLALDSPFGQPMSGTPMSRLSLDSPFKSNPGSPVARQHVSASRHSAPSPATSVRSEARESLRAAQSPRDFYYSRSLSSSLRSTAPQ
eukprot:scaffold535701_cov38-Prasinocladus_malaysianus.AAC.1